MPLEVCVPKRTWATASPEALSGRVNEKVCDLFALKSLSEKSTPGQTGIVKVTLMDNAFGKSAYRSWKKPTTEARLGTFQKAGPPSYYITAQSRVRIHFVCPYGRLLSLAPTVHVLRSTAKNTTPFGVTTEGTGGRSSGIDSERISGNILPPNP